MIWRDVADIDLVKSIGIQFVGYDTTVTSANFYVDAVIGEGGSAPPVSNSLFDYTDNWLWKDGGAVPIDSSGTELSVCSV